MTLRQHADLVDSAMRVSITPSLRKDFASQNCPLDADDAIASLHSRIDLLDRLLRDPDATVQNSGANGSWNRQNVPYSRKIYMWWARGFTLPRA